MSGTQTAPQKYSLLNDNIDTIPLMAADAAGDMVALPPGRTPTLVNGDPASLNAVIDGTNLKINALVPTATNISLEIDDGTLAPFFMSIDIVEDLTPVSVSPNLVAVTHESQPRPTVTTPTPEPTPTPTPTPEPTPTPAPTTDDTGTVTAPGDNGSPTPGPADTTQPPAPTV